LRTESAPLGIISYEFAGDLDRAREMVRSWGERGQVYAGLNLGLDYLFIPLYVLTIGLGCGLVAAGMEKGSGSLAGVGLVLSWGQVGAGSLDALENFALIRVLLWAENDFWPALARWSAILKFALVVAGIVYLLSGAMVNVILGGRQGRQGGVENDRIEDKKTGRKDAKDRHPGE
jgi:hypothetical protein